jgi:hypothetical protein
MVGVRPCNDWVRAKSVTLRRAWMRERPFAIVTTDMAVN